MCGYRQSGDSSELAPGLPCKGKSLRNRGVSQIMLFLVIPRSLLRGGFILPGIPDEPIVLAWFRLLSLRCSRAVFRKECQNLCCTAGVIHHIGFTYGPQDMFEVL